MPKVNYTAAKGLYQETGSGVDLATDTTGVTFRQKTLTLSTAGTHAAPTRKLSAADSGTVFFVDISTVSVVARLPAPSAGLFYKFILNVASHDEDAKDFVLSTGDDAVDINGNLFVHNAHVEVTNATSAVIIDSSDADATIGDYFEVCCDGTDWYIFGMVDSASAIDLTNAADGHTVP